MIPIIIFIFGGFGLAFTGFRILLKKEVIITSRNTKYWFLPVIFKAFVPGAYDPVSFRLINWKKNLIGLALFILGIFACIVSWQLIMMLSILSDIPQAK